MKTDKYVIRSLIATTIIAFVFIILTSYFALSRSQYREELVAVQNELMLTKDELISTQESYQIEIENSAFLNNELNKVINEFDVVQSDLEKAKATISNLKSNEYRFIYIGDYKLTHYCTEQRKHICGTGTGLTATGTQATAGRTVAVDPSVIPYGTKLYIEGYGWRVAEDCGGAVDGKHIDIAVETHSQAISLSTTTGGIWILVK